MNVSDVDKQEIVGDKLEAIFARQRELMERYHKIEAENGLLLTDQVPVDLDSYKGQARLRDFIYRTTAELFESGECLKLKAWVQTPLATDRQHFYEEIADALHFMIEFCILAGLDAQSLTDYYFRKSKVNIFRQGSNY